MMRDDSLSIIIPTAGRLSLLDTLRSYAHQLGPDDEVLVMGDETDGPLLTSPAIVTGFGPQFRYVPVPSTFHSWGHMEANTGFDLARGSHLMLQDDDDIATPNALADIRAAIAEQPHPRPLLFQFMTPWREVLWAERQIVENRIGGHCLVQPNLPGKVARMTPRYSGDFDQIVRAMEFYGGDVAWIPKLIAWTRPTAKELRTMIPEGVAV